MTVTNSTNKMIAQGNGATTVFSFTFIGVAASDVEVIFTDALGNQTVLTPSQYTLALNPPLPGQLWGNGGSVTYPTVASGAPPIAAGTSLTIARELPYTQGISISNQTTAYLSVIEQALDLLTMQAQQLAEQEGRTLQFPIVDLAPTTTLPAAVQRANMGLAFDANGNPIAGALPSVAVSSTMAPVFQASSLAAALQALGGGATGISVFQAATTAAAVAALGLLGAAQTFKSTTSGAAVEEFLTLLRNKGVAGSNADFGEALAFAMMNAADAQKTFARTYAEIIGNTAGSETGALLWDTIQNGALAPRMTLQAGLQIGSPTGGDKGAGSVNATGLYVNGQPVADGFSLNFAHFREQQPSGTSSADGSVTGGAWNRRTLNTTVFNSILGCSLSGSQVTLPAGTYYFNAEITSTEGAAQPYEFTRRLRDTTTPVTLMTGPNDFMNNVVSNNNTGFRSRAEGRFTIAAQKAIEIDWYINSGSGGVAERRSRRARLRSIPSCGSGRSRDACDTCSYPFCKPAGPADPNSRHPMTSGDLNAISQAIGGLQESARQAQRSHDAMWSELKQMRGDLVEVLALKRDVAEMRPHVDDWRRTKQCGIGLLAMAGFGGGMLGQGL